MVGKRNQTEANSEKTDQFQKAPLRLAYNTQAAGIAVWEFDLATGVLRWDVNFSKLYGYPETQLVGDYESWRSRVHPDDLDSSETIFQASIKSGDPFIDIFRIIRTDGVLRSIKAHSQTFYAEDGTPAKVVGINYDVTEEVDAETRALEAAASLREANERLNRLADNAPGALFEYYEAPDGTPSYPYYSAKFASVLGLDDQGQPFTMEQTIANIYPDDLPLVVDEITRSRENLDTFNVRYRVNHPELGERWIQAQSDPVAQDDGSITWYGFLFDVTETKRSDDLAAAAVEERNAAKNRLFNIANVAPVGIYELLRHQDGRYSFPYCNDYFLQILGVTRDDITLDGTSAFSRVIEDDFPGVISALDRSADLMDPFSIRFRIRNAYGAITWLTARSDVSQKENGEVVWTGAVMDVTKDVARENELRAARQEAERIQAENERQALHDGLTGLPNRRFYDRMFEGRVASAQNGGARDAVLVRIDLDHFKHVNDTLGHAAGDHVLTHVAQVLKKSIRKSDFVARIGGDEFSILMASGTTQAEAQTMIDRARKRLSKPVIFNGRQCRFGSSFGIAQIDDLLMATTELHLYADAALYRAKEKGRNRVETYTPSLHHEVMQHRRYAEELHVALEASQFEPYFQPQIDTASGRISGAEILLRWNHPTEGVLAPPTFMSVADQLKIVGDIDHQMMDQTQGALDFFRAQGVILPKISLNVSATRMHDKNLLALAKGLDLGETRLAFELLESILVEDESDVFRYHLDLLHEAGIEIEIDDFGSGHASILSLLESAASCLKIDQRLIRPLEHDQRARNLVRAIIEIAETLDIRTTSEGVETAGQRDILADLGCDTLQGYLYSKPLPAAEFAVYARKVGCHQKVKEGSLKDSA